MTITITLTAEIGSAQGVDFNTEFTSYFSGLVPTGWPYILGGGSQFDGDEIVLLDKIVEGQESDTKAIILDGSDFNYYFNDHTLSGTLTTVRLSTLGDSYNSSNGSFDQDENDHIINVTTPIEISGLNISNPYGTKGDLHDVIYALMGGAHDGGGFSNPDPLEGFLWAEAHNIVGSTGADKYSGTQFGDTIRGNGGNDVFDGKGGTDTAVFSGTKASYTLTKNEDGSVTVQDNRAGKDGKDTLTNIEIAKFSDGTVDLTALTTEDKAPTSLALSKASIAENSAIGTTIGTLSAVDPEGKTLTYKLTDAAGGLFKLSGNKLQLAKAVNYEALKSDTITVEVSDPAGNKTTKTFTISITDVNEAPGSVTLSKATVAENTAIGTMIGMLSAVDPEGKALTYTLTDNAGGLFKLSGNKLQVAKAINYEAVQSDTITVQVKDAGGLTVTKTFAIGVTDVLETITGTTAAETLKGGIGADKILGGDGNDGLYGYGANDQLFGEAGNDTLNGGAGADKLDGGAGTDTASYAGAKAGVTASLANSAINTGDALGDTYISVERLTGSSYADKLYGNSAANLLTGGAGNDILSGDAGNDTIYGGLGADDLTGGTGSDTFVFKTLSDSTVAVAGRDTIFDFSGTAGDKIDLSAIDANSAIAGDQAFTYLGTAAFTGTAGELRYIKQASDTYIYGDTNGDKKVDFAIHLDDAVTLSKGYFVL